MHIPSLEYAESTKTQPIRYRTTDATVDADLFLLEIQATIAFGYLQAGDTLVLDNAANHTGT